MCLSADNDGRGVVYNERVDGTLGFPAKKEFPLCKQANTQSHSDSSSFREKSTVFSDSAMCSVCMQASIIRNHFPERKIAKMVTELGGFPLPPAGGTFAGKKTFFFFKNMWAYKMADFGIPDCLQ